MTVSKFGKFAIVAVFLSAASSPCLAGEKINYAPIQPGLFSEAPLDRPGAADVMSTPKLDLYKITQPKTFSEKTSELMFRAVDLLGINYKFGGTTEETGLDCSGFVGLVFREAIGTRLPRTAKDLSRIGVKIKNNDLKTGDLVFYKTLKSKFSHVGIYMGNNKFIHSPSAGGQVRVESMATEYWSKRFSGGRRVVE